MKKILLLILVCVVSINVLFSQEVKIKVGSEIKTKTELVTMLGQFEDRIVGVFNQKKKYFFKSFNEDLELIDTKEIEIKYKGKKVRYYNVAKMNNRLFIFVLYDNKKVDKSYLLYKELDPKTFKSLSKLKVIDEAPYDKWIKKPFSFEYSKENKMLLLFRSIYNEEGGNEKIAIRVLDSDLNSKWERNITIPYINSLIDIIDYNVDLDGNVYIIIKKFKNKHKDIVNKKINFYYTMLTYKKDGKEEDEIELTINNKYITQLKMSVDRNQNIICSGFYSNNISNKSEKTMGLGGSFYMKIGKEANEISLSKTNDFTLDFIISLMSKRKQAKAKKKSKKKEKKNKNMEMDNYYLDDLYLDDNGGVILVGEKLYYYVSMVPDGQGGYNNKVTYFIQSIIAVKYDSEGEVKWVRKAPKFQKSTTTTYLSHTSIVNNGSVYFIYNDHIDNAEIKNSHDYKTFKVGYKNANIVAYRIDELGKTKYISLYPTAKLKAMLIPKASTKIGESNVLYLYIGRGNRERIARLYFNE